MATTIIDKDHGYSKLFKAVNSPIPELRVGIVHDAAHKGSNLSVGEIGEIHELGLGVPMRPWLRPAIDGRRAFVQARLRRVAEAVAMGRVTAVEGANLLGIELVSIIKARIRAGIAPALAESTKASKQNTAGQSKDIPLINTAQFIGSISHVVLPGRGLK